MLKNAFDYCNSLRICLTKRLNDIDFFEKNDEKEKLTFRERSRVFLWDVTKRRFFSSFLIVFLTFLICCVFIKYLRVQFYKFTSTIKTLLKYFKFSTSLLFYVSISICLIINQSIFFCCVICFFNIFAWEISNNCLIFDLRLMRFFLSFRFCYFQSS